jgi:hypothetical protein
MTVARTTAKRKPVVNRFRGGWENRRETEETVLLVSPKASYNEKDWNGEGNTGWRRKGRTKDRFWSLILRTLYFFSW